MAEYLKLQPNTPYVIEITGPLTEVQGRFGPQHNWPVRVSGVDYILSQSIGSGLDSALSSGNIGSSFNVIKVPNPQHQGSFMFNITPGTTMPVQQPATQQPVQQVEQASPTPVPPSSSGGGGADWDMINAVKTWQIQKSTTLELAVEMTVANYPKGKVEIDTVKALHEQLFALIRDDANLIATSLSACKSLDELGDLWNTEGRLWQSLISPNEMAKIGKFKETLKQSLAPVDEKSVDPFNAESTEDGLPF